jgi:hypothetical protein
MSIELPRLPQALAALLCAGLSGACAISPAAEAPKTPSVFAEPAAAPGAEPVLYARDGSVVSLADGPREAAGERAALARREVGTAESGRMYLLELYQQVIDERDGLAREVVALRADIDALRNTNAQAQERAVAMEQRLQTLEAEQVRMQAQNV